MNFLTAPIYLFFSIPFYRHVIRVPLSRGFLYLLYLSLIASILMFLAFSMRFIPQADAFIAWAKEQMPTLTWTEQGLSMDAQSPYTMVHPQFGSLVTFDTTKTEVTTEEMGDLPAFVTSTKVYVKQGNSEVRVYNLSEMMEQNQREGQLPAINGELLDTFYRSLKPWMLFMMVLFFFPFFFIWKLIAAILYSLAGLIINLFRTQKLPYSAILNVCLFALTPVSLIQMLQLLIPILGKIPFGMAGSLLVTTIYLFMGIKLTEGDYDSMGTPGSETSFS